MGKKVAIIQSCYLPWKGYFDIINSVDEFIFYDDVQYTKNDWRNRNLIKTKQGVQWITIPVHGGLDKLINEVEVANVNWAIKHWKTLENNYSKAKYFDQYIDLFGTLYTECRAMNNLSQINYKFTKAICDILNIKTKLLWSGDHLEQIDNITDKTARVVALCKCVNASYYISGPAGRNYISEEVFLQNGIEVRYFDYSGYKPYEQLYGEFEHGVSIVDLIFNQGPNAACYMKSFE